MDYNATLKVLAELNNPHNLPLYAVTTVAQWDALYAHHLIDYRGNLSPKGKAELDRYRSR